MFKYIHKENDQFSPDRTLRDIWNNLQYFLKNIFFAQDKSKVQRFMANLVARFYWEKKKEKKEKKEWNDTGREPTRMESVGIENKRVSRAMT